MMVSRECGSCPYIHTFCIKLRKLPFYKEFKMSKTAMEKLPRCFQETPLGDQKGSLRQYRGIDGSHALEYKNEWVIHRDKVDPRLDPLGHLVNDAPYVIVFGILAFVGLLGLIGALGGEHNEQ